MADQPLRVAEFDELFTAATLGVERVSATTAAVVLAAAPGRAAAVTDLARRETECCSFFTLVVTDRADETVLLEVTVPPTHVEVLDALVARAEQQARAAGPPRAPSDR